MSGSALDGILHGARVPGPVRDAIARRIGLLRRKRPAETRGPSPRLLLGEPLAVLAPLIRRFRAPVALPRTAHPRVVMLLPGFGTHPLRMRYMAQQLERALRGNAPGGLWWMCSFGAGFSCHGAFLKVD